MTHAWLPRASCDDSCVRVGSLGAWRRAGPGTACDRPDAGDRASLLAIPLLTIPQPGQPRAIRLYCWVVLRCMGVRITKSGGPIRNVPGVLVVSPHISWVDALVINTLMPGKFVAKAEADQVAGR